MPESRPVLIVAGSRRFGGRVALARTLSYMVREFGPFGALWHGGARGADALAGGWALRAGLPVRVWPADWNRFGSSAGPIRTRAMLAAAPPGSILVVFVPGSLLSSAGSRYAVRVALTVGLYVFLCDGEGSRWLFSVADVGLLF